MINAQEAKYLQKASDGLEKALEVIEIIIRNAALNGESQVDLDFAPTFSNLLGNRYTNIAVILKSLGFKVSFSIYGTLLVEW